MTLLYKLPITSALGAVLLALAGCASVPEGPTVGDIVAQGAKRITKQDFQDRLPARIQQQWPNGQGEEELFLARDGKVTGTGLHYASKGTSSVEGTWSVADDGKLCIPKKFTVWGTSTNLCWYGYTVGTTMYAAQTTEPSSKVYKVNSFTKTGG